MAREATAIEQCAYCREYVPVTWVEIPASNDAPLRGTIAICENCYGDGT